MRELIFNPVKKKKTPRDYTKYYNMQKLFVNFNGRTYIH